MTNITAENPITDEMVERLVRFLQAEWAGPYMAHACDYVRIGMERGPEFDRAIEALHEADRAAQDEARRVAGRALCVALGLDCGVLESGMKARRIHLGPNDDPITLEPGDYAGPVVGWTGDKPAVFFRLPEDGNLTPNDRGLRHVVSPPHQFRECPDGSLEIRESILSSGGWHGYLDEGNIWRRV